MELAQAVMAKTQIPVVELSTQQSAANAASRSISTSKNKCATCNNSKCCQYTTNKIATPRSIRDFDNLIWQVSHDSTHVIKDTDGWFLLVYSSFQHLSEDGGCKIYRSRPFVCREHSNNNCEYDTSLEDSMQFYFSNHAELDDYCRTRFKRWDQRFD